MRLPSLFLHKIKHSLGIDPNRSAVARVECRFPRLLATLVLRSLPDERTRLKAVRLLHG